MIHIDIIDMANQKLMMPVTSTGSMSQSPSMEDCTDKINAPVAKIFVDFPPKKTSQ